MTRWMTAAGAAVLLCGTAMADDDRGFEIRLGVTAHDLADHVEDGPNITTEVLFPSPDFMSWAFEPRPFLYGSWNTNGLTNFGAAGLAWDFDWTERLNFEFKTGISYNDGVTDIDPNSDPGDPTRIRLATTRALMGAHWLFYNSFGLDYDLDENWSAGVYYEHISHGQILANGRNQALDNAGFRVGYRWGR